jgi:septal ring factor EnvC (AmiA/AmiB activator)
MAREPDTLERKCSRFRNGQQAQAKNTEELSKTIRRLNNATKPLEAEIKHTEDDIRKVHKTYRHSSRKKRRSA